MTAATRAPLTAAEWRLGLLWILAVVAGWVIGFYLCGVIQDFFSTFLVDGLVIGSAIGIGQGLVVRKRITPMLPWVVVSIIGYGIGKFFADTVGQAMPGLAGMAISGAIIGLMVGIVQSVVLRERFPKAWWWIVANAVGWTAAWVVISILDEATSSMVLAYVVGGLAAAVVGVITAIALIGLTRHPTPEPVARAG